jgi:hypothetical protein
MESKDLNKVLREEILNLASKNQELENEVKRYKNYSNKLNKHLRDRKKLNKANVATSTDNNNEEVLEFLTEIEKKISNEKLLKPLIEQMIDKLLELSNCADSKREMMIKKSITLKLENKFPEIDTNQKLTEDDDTSMESIDIISETSSMFNDFNEKKF